MAVILFWRKRELSCTRGGIELNKYILVLTTVPNKEVGQNITKNLLKERLAACVTISAACESHYWWQEEISQEPEYILFIKTRNTLFMDLKEKILKLHPYEVPEIIALPILHGHSKYLDWIDKETKGKRKA